MSSRESRFRYELKKRNIESLQKGRCVYKCKTCGNVWSPNIQTGGRFPRGWWKCPNGCNVDK